ncbi:MAG: hypothetical protein M3R17_09425 [Bacteroidota bacterium]|nr:hypothetical protein [Bacteroidota bacterium]
MIRFGWLFIFFVLIFSCNEDNSSGIRINIDSPFSDTADHISKHIYFQKEYHEPTTAEIEAEELKNGPVFGYRFVIKGDFDGDGKQELLTEHFYSRKLKRECCKFYDRMDYDHLVAFTVRKESFSFITCTNGKIDTCVIGNDAQLFGVAFMKNEGDLDGNGTDEFSYVANWADWSNCNSCHIMTYQKHKWKELYVFDVWEWQFPDLPQTTNQYGLIGLDEKITHTSDLILNGKQQNKLSAFPGLIKRIKPGTISIICRSPDSEKDTLVVKL